MTTQEKIQAVINDPSTSYWLKNALQLALKRDPVDAANDAHFLANILKEHCNAVLATIVSLRAIRLDLVDHSNHPFAAQAIKDLGTVIQHLELHVSSPPAKAQELYAAFQRINTIIFAQGLALGSDDYFTVRKLCVEGMKLAKLPDSPPADAVEDEQASPDAVAYRQAARSMYHNEGEVEIDDKAVVSFGDDPGAYVQAWVWVRASDAGIDNGEEEDRGEVDEPGNEPKGGA